MLRAEVQGATGHIGGAQCLNMVGQRRQTISAETRNSFPHSLSIVKINTLTMYRETTHDKHLIAFQKWARTNSSYYFTFFNDKTAITLY